MGSIWEANRCSLLCFISWKHLEWIYIYIYSIYIYSRANQNSNTGDFSQKKRWRQPEPQPQGKDGEGGRVWVRKGVLGGLSTLTNPLSMVVSGSLNRWKVPYNPPIGSIYHLYTTYSPCQLGDHMVPIPPIKGTRKLHWLYRVPKTLQCKASRKKWLLAPSSAQVLQLLSDHGTC